MSKPLVSRLWGCGESVDPPKLNIQEVQGALSSRSKEDPGPLPIFQDFILSVVLLSSLNKRSYILTEELPKRYIALVFIYLQSC